MSQAHIQDIEYILPKNMITNEDIAKMNPDWDINYVQSKTGVMTRYISGKNETALDLAHKAAEQLMKKNEAIRDSLDALIFCTQSNDYIMPPNSCILHKHLNLKENVFCTDFNLACSGFTYGLAICQGFIKSNMMKNILLINADTYSKYIHPRDRTCAVLFGDGASASLITAHESLGIIAINYATSGKNHDKFIIPAGGLRIPKSSETATPITLPNGSIRSQENIQMDGMGILVFVNSKVPKQIKKLLKDNNLQIGDIDLFVFHQASKMAIESLTKLLKIPKERIFSNLALIGNTVSASIPIALKDAKDQNRIKEGSKVLISGFGVGLSWSSAIIQY